MEDDRIIELYWERDQAAILHTQQKYGGYCGRIAGNILRNQEDCEECLNDTWLRAWNSMPTERPRILCAFLGAITRNLSLDRYRKNHSLKRGAGETACIFDEMRDCISTDGPEMHLDMLQLTESINSFLGGLDVKSRRMFVRRYWYMDSIREVSLRFGASESNVKSTLFRLRNSLREYLIEEGFEL